MPADADALAAPDGGTGECRQRALAEELIKRRTPMAKKKKAPAKKAGSKTRGGKRKSTASGIGLVSSIACRPAMKNAFEAGSGIVPKYKCDVGYKHLDDAVRAFVGDSGIGLIVTVGGLIAYKAANSVSTKPFVSLVGKLPTDGSV